MSVQEIRIKNDGKWYADDRLMFRKPIVKLFAMNLERDNGNGFYIRLNQETFPVTVEDVPFWLQRPILTRVRSCLSFMMSRR